MPLILPNQNPNATTASKTDEWQSKLVGKTLNETETNETVSRPSLDGEERVCG